MAQINKPNEYFNSVLYTGNGGTNNITGVGFQPDWVWVKDRTSANSHGLFDVIRGATNALLSNTTNATVTNANYLQSFDSDGFTLGSEGAFNTNTNNYVSWNWLADNTSGSSNTDGSITSTVSANTTSGFSIVSYTGTGSATTVGHGLGVAPAMAIVKDRDGTYAWYVYNKNLSGASYYIVLHGTGAEFENTDIYSSAPNSTVMNIGTHPGINGSGTNYIMYCFAEKKGFSKFGKYTGNGSTDGTFVYTGFKPAMIIIRRTDAINDWVMYDTVRNTYNEIKDYLEPNTSDAESTGTNDRNIDILSNGFKCRYTGNAINGSGGTYIYMAFAENPLVGTNNTPTTAR